MINNYSAFCQCTNSYLYCYIYRPWVWMGLKCLSSEKIYLYTVNEVSLCNAHVTSIIVWVPNAVGMTDWSGGYEHLEGDTVDFGLCLRVLWGFRAFLLPTVTWRECLESQLAVWSIWPTQTGAASDVLSLDGPLPFARQPN